MRRHRRRGRSRTTTPRARLLAGRCGSRASIGSLVIASGAPHNGEDPLKAAYGLRFEGLDGAGLLALEGADRAPLVRVDQSVAELVPDPNVHIRPTRASFPVGEGRIFLEREPASIRVRAPVPVSQDDIVHPWLARAAVMFAAWRGSATLHGGAFVAGDAAWGLLGGHEAGKSTLLAALAARGHRIVADDLLVIDDGRVHGGPRCVDLRPSAAATLGLAELDVHRGGQRHRLRLRPAPATVPLAGIVALEWADAPSVARVPLAERIPLLREHAALGALIPLHEERLLDLASLPSLALRRVPGLDRIDADVDRLLEAVGA